MYGFFFPRLESSATALLENENSAPSFSAQSLGVPKCGGSINAVVRRDTQMSAKERKHKSAKERQRALTRNNCSQLPKGPRRTKNTTRSKFTTRSIFSTAG